MQSAKCEKVINFRPVSLCAQVRGRGLKFGSRSILMKLHKKGLGKKVWVKLKIQNMAEDEKN